MLGEISNYSTSQHFRTDHQGRSHENTMLFKFALLCLSATSAVVSAVAVKRAPGGVVKKAGEPVVIDPKGDYLRVSFMNDGSLIGGYTAIQDNGENVLKTVRSVDGGASWQYLGEVFRGPRAKHDINNAMPLQLPSGRVLYAYRNHDRTGDDFHYTYFRISISYSDDSGVTFKYLSTVEEKVPVANTASGLWEPFLRLARDGTLQCYYSAENNGGDQDGFMKYSKDGGATWSNWIAVSGGDVTSRDGMIGVAPIDNDGNLMYVIPVPLTSFLFLSWLSARQLPDNF